MHSFESKIPEISIFYYKSGHDAPTLKSQSFGSNHQPALFEVCLIRFVSSHPIDLTFYWMSMLLDLIPSISLKLKHTRLDSLARQKIGVGEARNPSFSTCSRMEDLPSLITQVPRRKLLLPERLHSFQPVQAFRSKGMLISK